MSVVDDQSKLDVGLVDDRPLRKVGQPEVEIASLVPERTFGDDEKSVPSEVQIPLLTRCRPSTGDVAVPGCGNPVDVRVVRWRYKLVASGLCKTGQEQDGKK